ncbi:hypothetical protein GF352_05010 [archaeon]|nr:hypothetical protein [archaeon]
MRDASGSEQVELEERGKRAQAAIESIIIFGMSTLIVLLLLTTGLNTQASTSDALRISQARTTVNEITSTADEVWSQGPGASAKIVIVVPTEVNESESGILGGKTVRYRVLTRGDFTDVSEVSVVNITGTLPIISGQYELLITAREEDVVLTLLSTLNVDTDEDSYCEGDTVYYYITALDEQSQPRIVNVTIQLLDPDGIIRGEHNKTTISGLTNGSFTIPSIGEYGYWKVYAYDNETNNFKNILVNNCANITDLSIINCHTNDTYLTYGESANLACWVIGVNPVDTVIFNISSTNYSAFHDGDNWWNYTLDCYSNNTYTWTEAWANDTTGLTTSTTGNGLPITVYCNISCDDPVINSTSVNDTIVNQYEYVCINTSVTDSEDNLDTVWAYILTPSGTVNLTLIDTGPWCAGIANDSWYGAELQLNEEGTYTLISAWANDTLGCSEKDVVNTNIQSIEFFEFLESDIYVNYPDSAIKNQIVKHSFLAWNNDTTSITINRVQEKWGQTLSTGFQTCQLISPSGANLTCNCVSGEGCNVTWNGNFTISPKNYTIFSYNFVNYGLMQMNVNATAKFNVVNGGNVSKTRWLDFRYFIPTAEIELSIDNSTWFQGINAPSNQSTTIYVRLEEASDIFTSDLDSPQVRLLLPKTWTNVSSPGTVTDLGGAWEINYSFPTIDYGESGVFSFTGKSPNESGLTVINATIYGSSSSDYVNETNIHELGIRTVKSCTNHTNCSTGYYCSEYGLCENKKGVGGNCSIGQVYDSLTRNETCISNWCRQDFINDENWFCVLDNNDCTQNGITRNNGFIACVDNSTEITCSNGIWVNESSCISYQGCDSSSIKATYCGWQTLTSTCSTGTGCGAPTPGSCNDCDSYYEDSPFNACSYTSGIIYCDEGCGAACDNSTDYYFNDPGDQCSYGCNNTCDYDYIDTCGDPGDLYGSTCYYGTNGCDNTGCITSTEDCPNWCINDYDGGSCSFLTRTNPSNSDTCYYNRQCLTSGCNLSSADALRQDYCDYCGISGAVSGDYSPALNATCSSSCPNSGTRYWDDTVTRSDDCDSSGNEQINTESYQQGYIYPSQTAVGYCDDTECSLDCGGSGSCFGSVCNCVTLVNITVFNEDFTPTPYYNYNWSRQGTDWDSQNNANCHSAGGCAHADGFVDETNDWILTDSGLINLSGANEVYLDFWVREDVSFDSGEYLRVWCYDGSNYITTYEEDMGDWTSNGAQRHRYTTVDSDCWISDARFAITIQANWFNEDVYIDDFRLQKEVYI